VPLKLPRLIALLHALASAVTLTAIAVAQTLDDARITEFVARNQDGLQDIDGDSSDWIEIWNASGVAGDLAG